MKKLIGLTLLFGALAGAVMPLQAGDVEPESNLVKKKPAHGIETRVTGHVITIHGDGTAQVEDLETGDDSQTPHTRVTGKVIVIGPDGKVQESHIIQGNEIPSAESLLKSFGINIEASGEKGTSSPSIKIIEGKALQIDTEGNISNIDSLPAKIQELIKKASEESSLSIKGNVTVIGPDGKTRSLPIVPSELQEGGLTTLIEKALKESGQELPDDIREAIEQQMRAGHSKEPKSPIAEPEKTPGDTQILNKLDELIKRLDKIESRLDDIDKTRAE